MPLCLSALVASILLVFSCGKKSDLPNVILISIDTLRSDHLGCYGYERDTSPTIDSLAAEGVQFRNVQAQSPWTLPSHASLLSSTFPFTHGVVDDNSRIPADLPMMAEILKSHGYKCSGVVSGFYLTDTFGFDRGFDNFEDFGLKKGQPLVPQLKILADEVTGLGLEWLKNKDEPFFLFLHYFDAHFNYVLPEAYEKLFDQAYDGRKILYTVPEQSLTPAEKHHVLALYDAAIAYIDANIRRVVETLRANGIADRTLLIITSDHGEEFFERGSWGHGHTLYREVLDVPLIIVDPRSERSGGRVYERARLIDVLPTLLDALGLPPSEAAQGRSLWPLVVGNAIPADEPLFLAETSRANENRVSLTRGVAKLIANLRDNEREVYDLEKDPAEVDDLNLEDPALGATLLDETLAISAGLIPGRLHLRWLAAGESHRFSGALRSPGVLIEAESREDGVDMEISADKHTLTFSSVQPGELSLAVLPVDASILLDLTIDGEPATRSVVLGADAARADEMPILFPGVIRSPHLLEPPPDRGTGFYIWKDPGDRMTVEPVDLSEETKEHLRSLGYLH